MKVRSDNKLVRSLAAILLALMLLLLTWSTGRAGLSSLISIYASRFYDDAAADVAVSLNHNSPDAHYVRGSILEARKDLIAAAAEYQQATVNRPDDCVYWISLARVLELNGDAAGALAAARRAVPLAPYYAQPHWQLGNILMRAGQTDEAFKELRLATASDPRLLPGVIDLAWRVSRNAQFVEQAVQPQTSQEFQSLGQYLRNVGELDAALYFYQASGGQALEQERQANVAALVAAKRYKEAYSLWDASGHQRIGSVVDSGFETEGNLEAAGFGWRTAENTQGFQLSLDTANPKDGRTSLKVEFKGDSQPDVSVISQLVIVEPNSRYQVSFSARTESIVTGGLPQVKVADAENNYSLGESEVLAAGTNGWKDYSFEFSSGEAATAVQLKLQRQPCSSPSCPIFGRLWLDQVSLRKL